MKKILLKVKNVFSKNVIAVNVLFSLISIILTCQSSAFLFNPFILVLLCASYVISFSTLLTNSICMIVTGFIIDKTYGIELTVLAVIYIIFYFGCKILQNKQLKIYGPMVLTNVTILIIYYITSNDVFYRINSLILCQISILLSINIIHIISKYKNKEEVNVISLALLIGMISTLFVFVETFSFLWVTILLLLIVRMNRQEVYLISTFISFVFFYYYSNNSINVLLAIYTSFLIIGLLNFKYNYFFFVPFVSILFLSINKEFYLDPIYYQLILGFLLMCLFPNSLINDLKVKINYLPRDSLKDIVEYQNRKFVEISNLCDLLMDDRFDKFENIEEQLEKVIKKDVCSKCSNNKECKMSVSKYLTGYLSNNEKSEINDKCIYPYQITKSINNVNKRIVDYSERELKSVESKKIMNNAYQIIKDYIDLRPINKKVKRKFSYSYEVLSLEASNSPNGDAYRLYEDEYYTMLLLSDGMGHTTKSRDISQYLIELVNYLILISSDAKSAIDSANQILLAKTYEEVYATLDLCQFDLENGKIKLYKAGSFPTFLIRNKKVKEISTKLPPIGIINNININEEEIEIKNNDIILFLTDGFGENVAETIEKTIQKASFLPLKSYLKFLQNSLNKAVKVEDDQTLIGIKINKI